MFDPLIDAATLLNHIDGPDWLIFDVRYSLADPEAGGHAYEHGHIPGARFLSQNSQLAGQCTGSNGRHPLPALQDLQALLRQHGLAPGMRVVVYDENDAAFAARAWWLIRWAGHSDVRVLNGGWQAWCAAGGAVDRQTHEPANADLGAGAQALADRPSMPVTSAADILAGAAAPDAVLLDARAATRYRGETEPLDPVAGHIPGALNRPVTRNVGPDGRFRDAAQLREEFLDLLDGRSSSQVIHYCGSGITACHNILAMEVAGLPGSVLYPGSWSEWCSDSSRPVGRS